MGNFNKIVLDDETLEVEDTKARTDIGDVSSLQTTTKESIVKAVNECFQSASDGKKAVANAITGAGVSTNASATFATMATNIGTVATNKYNAGVSATKVGTATASQVLTGYTFTNSSAVGASGTMANNGAVSQALNAGGSYTIPAGYHNGSGKVTANSLASQTSGTATAAQILAGYTAYVNGVKLTGTATFGKKYAKGTAYTVGTHPNSARIYWRALREGTESARNTSGQTIAIDPGFAASVLKVGYTYMSNEGIVYYYTVALLNDESSFQFSCANDEGAGEDYGYSSYFQGYVTPRVGNVFYVPSWHLSSVMQRLDWEAWE